MWGPRTLNADDYDCPSDTASNFVQPHFQGCHILHMSTRSDEGRDAGSGKTLPRQLNSASVPFFQK